MLSGCKKAVNNTDLCIQKGDFNATLIETGELQAVKAKPVLVPYVGWKYGWLFRITELAEHGSQIEEGDTVAQLDPSNVRKFLLEQENLLDVEKANLNKLIVEHDVRAKELEASLYEVLADFNLRKLNLEKFEFETQRKRDVKDLEFQQAQINLARIKRTIELEEKICRNGLKIQKIKVLQLESDVTDALAAIEKLTILSPLDGIFQISLNEMTDNDQLYRVGDNTYQRAQLALVPDLRQIKVKSTIHEIDIGKVKLGQKVIIKLEAFPEKPFKGSISEIGKLSYKKEEDSKLKIFNLEIVLDQSDPVLKPGMTVSCEIYYAELKEVFYVDNSCLKKADGTYYLYVKENNSWVEHPVEIGPRNNKYTVVYGDLKQGAELKVPTREAIAQNQ
jgi:multidrug efflux pump subunit AcrA (membrane-fusion protein)